MNRRLLLAVLGAVLGVVGAMLALTLTPTAALLAAIGALLAAGGSILLPEGTAAGSEPARSRPDSAPAHDIVGEVSVVGTPMSTGGTTVVASENGVTASGAPVLIDAATGLFSQDYFDVAIDARIAAARRHLRPVGVVMLEVVEGLHSGETQAVDPKRVAESISATLREADTACRRGDGRFALLLEDTPENGAIWTVERIRRHLCEHDDTLTLWAGVACYPAHGFSSDVLVKLSGAALDAAREWRQDRIEVAVGE